MERIIILRTHALGAVATLVLLTSFWLSTLISELCGQKSLIIAVKCTIPWLFLLLIPAIAITAATGFKLAGHSQLSLVKTKKKRMPFIALNGIIFLIPCAFLLRHLALEQNFGGWFVVLQLIELIAGAINITLIMMNIRAGRQLAH